MTASPEFRTPFRVALIAAAVVATGLVGCQRHEERTAQRDADRAVAQAERQTERQADQARADIREGAAEAKRDMRDAAADAQNAVNDAAITASINAKLAGDSELSALRIDVDTVGGRVALSGQAPNDTARQRATQIASSVSGVRSVDNQLAVG